MNRTTIVSLMLLSIAGGSSVLADSPHPEIGRYRAHVATLASREYAGRRGIGATRAAEYVGREFLRLGLAPGFGKSYVQEVTAGDGQGVIGHNIAAKIVGSDPTLRDEWIIVAAHFDHLGGSGDAYYPGADDNATGVAMMLEVARCLATDEMRPRRSVLFVGFDLEEYGLLGSRYFINHSPFPVEKIKLFVTADMIGRSLGGVCDQFVFLFGTETSPGMKAIVDTASSGEAIRIAPLGNDLLMVDRSDYGPFRRRSVPYLFFSTGENPHYHRRSDRSETIDYETALATTRVIAEIIRQAAKRATMPGWNGQTEPSLEEAMAVRDILNLMMANRERLDLSFAAQFVLKSALKSLDGVASRGKVTVAERSRLVRAVQFLLTTTF